MFTGLLTRVCYCSFRVRKKRESKSRSRYFLYFCFWGVDIAETICKQDKNWTSCARRFKIIAGERPLKALSEASLREIVLVMHSAQTMDLKTGYCSNSKLCSWSFWSFIKNRHVSVRSCTRWNIYLFRWLKFYWPNVVKSGTEMCFSGRERLKTYYVISLI